MPIISNYPKEIVYDKDCDFHVASFSYYDGIAVAKERSLKQTTEFTDVYNGTHFIVCCGDVMIKVKASEFPELNRRII